MSRAGAPLARAVQLHAVMNIRNFATVMFEIGCLFMATGCVVDANSTEADAAEADAAEAAKPGVEAATESEPVSTVASPITNGFEPDQFLRRVSVNINTPLPGTNLIRGCTGVIIDKQHILTAAHCKLGVGRTMVDFYDTNNTPLGQPIGISKVSLRPGVVSCPGLSGSCSEEFDDVNGDEADLAVATLVSPIPATSRIAELALSYAGEEANAIEVGRGEHDGLANLTGRLLAARNTFYSSDASGGYFYMHDQNADPGDSGGPVLVAGKVQGIVKGGAWFPFNHVDMCTSTTWHLPFILDAIAYRGPNVRKVNNYMVGGSAKSTIFTFSARVCEYVCDHDSACRGYTHFAGVCTIRSAISSDSVTINGAISGTKP